MKQKCCRHLSTTTASSEKNRSETPLTLLRIIMVIRFTMAPVMFAICWAFAFVEGFFARGLYTNNLYTITPNINTNTKDTIVRTTAMPENTRWVRLSSGKWGSMIPVTGFRATVGANAANVGLGRSWQKHGWKYYCIFASKHNNFKNLFTSNLQRLLHIRVHPNDRPMWSLFSSKIQGKTQLVNKSHKLVNN